MKNEKIILNHAEAWVDVMPVQPTAGGTLHVVVELNSDNHGRNFLKKVVPQGINPRILLLEIKISPNDIFIPNTQHATYVEGLDQSDQFTSIEIQFDGSVITDISSIPIIK